MPQNGSTRAAAASRKVFEPLARLSGSYDPTALNARACSWAPLGCVDLFLGILTHAIFLYAINGMSPKSVMALSRNTVGLVGAVVDRAFAVVRGVVDAFVASTAPAASTGRTFLHATGSNISAPQPCQIAVM